MLGLGSWGWEGFICSFPSVLHSCPASRQKVLSLVSCFAGGVFLATCLLDLLPDYLAAIDEALAALHVTVSEHWLAARGVFNCTPPGEVVCMDLFLCHSVSLACDPMNCDFSSQGIGLSVGSFP